MKSNDFIIKKIPFYGCIHVADDVYSMDGEWLDFIDATRNGNLFWEELVLVRYIGDATYVRIPDGITTIGPRAFENTIVEEVYIPDGVLWICENAFCNCVELKSISIPNSITYIGNRAFEDCCYLKKIFINPNSEEKWNGKFNSENSENTFSGIKPKDTDFPVICYEHKIDRGAFKNCLSLERVEIPMNILNIEDGAFVSCRKTDEMVCYKSLNGSGNYIDEEFGLITPQSIIVKDIASIPRYENYREIYEELDDSFDQRGDYDADFNSSVYSHETVDWLEYHMDM